LEKENTMGQPFLAYVIPVSGGQPDQGLPGQPPGIWPGPGFPTHPIAPGGPPPGIWPGQPGHRPDQGLPQPPGIWPNPPGGGNRPDQGLPPGTVIPPPQVGIPIFPGQLPSFGGEGGKPDQSLPGGQPGVSNPIAGGFILVYHPSYGYVLVKQGGSSGGGSPDQSLPGSQPGPDQGLPSQPPKPDQGLPPGQPTPTPHGGGSEQGRMRR
jgi:hypothetical protein